MVSPVRLYLARHGRTQWNHERRFQGFTDVPLDEVGRAQARALADLLRGRVEAVIGSDLSRASESARIVAEVLEVPLLGLDADLRERGYGVFEGLTREDCIARYPAEWAARLGNRNFLAPGAELPASVVERMQRGLERAVALVRGKHESALVVGHGSATRMFIELLSGNAEHPMGNMEFREVLHDGDKFTLI
ncbi:MAG TPA: histidine phosphatase family protein [Polyangiales bacterium]|nr:histidine phosphatase family protein [Polyangiales bacterium]